MTLRRRTVITSYIFMLPALAVFTIFFVYPCLTSAYYSLTSWDGVSPIKQFVGLQNYIKIFSNAALVQTFPVTIVFAVANTVSLSLCALVVALALNRPSRLTKILRVAYFVPVLLSGIVVGFLFRQIFAAVYDTSTMQMGAFNALLYRVGLGSLMRNWLMDPSFALPCIVFVSTWQSLGFYTLIYLANMQGMPKEYFEAASIDGAGSWQKFRYITWPQLAPALTINLTLLIIASLKSFDLFLTMTSGGPMGKTKVIGLAIYQAAFRDNRVGLASAYSLVLTAAVALLTLVANKFLRRREENL